METDVTIRDIAENMFVPGSAHMMRLEQLGARFAKETLWQKRHFLKQIIRDFGDRRLEDVAMPEIMSYMFRIKCSGSWKNHFLTAWKNLYEEYPYHTNKFIITPRFERFVCRSKKADLLTSDELHAFFDRTLWTDERTYLFFLTIFSGGLRCGEGRALKVNQILFDKSALIINGFMKRNGVRTNFCKCGSEHDPKFRVVILPDDTLQRLRHYIQGNELRPDDFLFTEHGHPLRLEHARCIFQRQLEKAGIEKNGRKLVPHSLRYTYVTRMRHNLGYNESETVRQLAGHTSLKMTDYYTLIEIPEMIETLQPTKAAADMLLA